MNEGPQGAGVEVEVATPRGLLVGERAADGQTVSFKGIGYARPPVGALRWRPPVTAPGWAGRRQAKAIGPAAMQLRLSDDAFYADNPPSMSEDCLTLNVWGPAAATQAPVMVWIHGGNLVFGSGGNPRYDGAALARLGVVMVTINYRLGVFGYFAHPELSAETPMGVSGNYGTLDQIEALRWVRDNVAAFGGDPDNVTIFGQSAGGLSVTHLMTSPLSRGLFHRAIAMSAHLPAMPELKAPTLGQPSAEANGVAFGARAKANNLAELRAMPPQALLETIAETGFVAEGTVDGWVHPAQVFDTFAAGGQAKVPLIIGFTNDETRSFGGQGFLPQPPDDPAAYKALIRRLYGDLSERYLAQYPPADPAGAMHDAARDGFYGRATLRIARDHAASGAATYLYAFRHVYPSASEMGVRAFHSSDVPFVFGNVGPAAIAPPNWPSPPRSADDVALSGAIMAYWTAFARGGRPEAPGLPAWIASAAPSGDYMAFTVGRARPSHHLLPGMFELSEDIVASRRAAGLAWWRWANIGLCLQGVKAPGPAA